MAAKLGMPEIASLMRRYLEEDSGKRSVTTEGASIDEALRGAALQLGVPVKRLEYELVERGSAGLLGLGKKSWKIRATLSAEKKDLESAATGPGAEEAAPELQTEEVRDRDGECFVRLANDGALLKVMPAQGRGRRPSEKQAVDRLHARAVHNFDENLVRETVRLSQNIWVRVGDFISNLANNTLITLDLGEQEMSAYVMLNPPGPGGCDFSKEEIAGFLRNNGIVYGIDEAALQDIENKPRYRDQLLVASGTKPQNGRDAHVEFNFETDKNRARLREAADGRVNFKELGLIQNVVAGQPLARRMPPENGQSGRTVTGKIVPARNGKDIISPLGRNVRMADDGFTILADINGQVIYSGGKINVEEIFTVLGDVDLKTGNIMFLGTVIVNGNVTDGFTVKASGNIDVRGNVGKCELVAEGDIVVHLGVNGRGGGSIEAGKSVWSKFIENATVSAGENIIVSDGLINSNVIANKKILCQGKRAAIVGGKYRACEEINAKTLGSTAGGTETVLEVGYDPRSKEKLDKIFAQIYQIKKEVEELDKNIMTLTVMKKQRKTLPDEKEAVLQNSLARRAELAEQIAGLANEAESLQTYLNGLKIKGRISASGRVYPGVKLVIKDIKEEIKTEQKGITFYLENQMIRTTKYVEIEDDILRKGPPDARKTN